MKEIIHKIFQTVNFHENNRLVIFNFKNNSHNLDKIQFKTFNANISTIKSKSEACTNLFSDIFPYNPIENLCNDLLPPRIFFHSLNTPKNLLVENNQKEIIEYCPYINFIKNLKFYGRLKQKKDKSVYLELENDFFIHLISNYLIDRRIEKTDNFNINIISKDEYDKKEVFEILENDLNQRYEFTIKNLYSINVIDEEFTNKLWFIEFESKDLEEFRYKYHLFPKINGYNFSVVLGRIKYFKMRKSFPKMRINAT